MDVPLGLGDGVPADGRLSCFSGVSRPPLDHAPATVSDLFRHHLVLVRLALVMVAAGAILGVLSTAVYAYIQDWATVTPVETWAGGLAATLIIGAAAGPLPALRVARISPTQALWAM